MRERSLAPEPVEALDEFLGRRCTLAEHEHVLFDLSVRIAVELGPPIVVGADRCVDGLGGLAEIAGLSQDVGAVAGTDGNTGGEKQASVHPPWTREAGKRLVRTCHSAVIRFSLSMIG